MKLKTSLIALAIVTSIGTVGAFAQQNPPAFTSPEKVPPRTFNTSPEDHARIQKIFSNERSATQLKHLTFKLTPGAVVPHSVRLVELPPTVFDIQPTWRGDEYFMFKRKIVVVEPHSMKIVAVFSV